MKSGNTFSKLRTVNVKPTLSTFFSKRLVNKYRLADFSFPHLERFLILEGNFCWETNQRPMKKQVIVQTIVDADLHELLVIQKLLQKTDCNFTKLRFLWFKENDNKDNFRYKNERHTLNFSKIFLNKFEKKSNLQLVECSKESNFHFYN